MKNKKFATVAGLLLSLSLSANATETPIQKLKLHCEAQGDASDLLASGTAWMETSVEGTLEMDPSKKNFEEEGWETSPASTDFRYRMKFEMTTTFGRESGLSQGHVTNAALDVYTQSKTRDMHFIVTNPGPNYASIFFRYKKASGVWTAQLTTSVAGPTASDQLKRQHLNSREMTCSVNSAE